MPVAVGMDYTTGYQLTNVSQRVFVSSGGHNRKGSTRGLDFRFSLYTAYRERAIARARAVERSKRYAELSMVITVRQAFVSAFEAVPISVNAARMASATLTSASPH
jgi:hypothetical protein